MSRQEKKTKAPDTYPPFWRIDYPPNLTLASMAVSAASVVMLAIGLGGAGLTGFFAGVAGMGLADFMEEKEKGEKA